MWLCAFNLYLGSSGTMPGAPSALLLRALVLCTIRTTTTAATVVLVDGFLTGKSASRSLDCAPRPVFRLDEIFPLRAPAQIRGEKSSPEIDAGPVAALQACSLKSPAALRYPSVDCFDTSLSCFVHFCWEFPHVQATSTLDPEHNMDSFPASPIILARTGCANEVLGEYTPPDCAMASPSCPEASRGSMEMTPRKPPLQSLTIISGAFSNNPMALQNLKDT